MEQEPYPQQLDRDAFERVWRRVMPADRPDCPFTLEPPGGQAPAEPPQEEAPQPASLPLPAAAPRQEAPALCLGAGSAGEVPTLEALLEQVTDSARIYRALAARPGLKALGELARLRQRGAKRLSTARFLITGALWTPRPTPAPQRGSAAAALRERFQAEQELFRALNAAAEQTADPCLGQLYRALAEEARGCGRRLWELMEAL